ncbi:MAG: hypothetical protein U9R73_00665 [Pseudomonadota bacterium]|nr:hypothetical protein [Pseudomonadota bacterium]
MTRTLECFIALKHGRPVWGSIAATSGAAWENVEHRPNQPINQLQALGYRVVPARISIDGQ